MSATKAKRFETDLAKLRAEARALREELFFIRLEMLARAEAFSQPLKTEARS